MKETNGTAASTTKRRQYDADFKAHVLSLVESGQAVSRVAKSLGIAEKVIYHWRSRRNKSDLSGVAGTELGKKEATALQRLMEENRRLSETVRRMETEREILKKAYETCFVRLTLFSAKPPPRGLSDDGSIRKSVCGRNAV